MANKLLFYSVWPLQCVQVSLEPREKMLQTSWSHPYKCWQSASDQNNHKEVFGAASSLWSVSLSDSQQPFTSRSGNTSLLRTVLLRSNRDIKRQEKSLLISISSVLSIMMLMFGPCGLLESIQEKNRSFTSWILNEWLSETVTWNSFHYIHPFDNMIVTTNR